MTKPTSPSFIESAQTLVKPPAQEWSHDELLRAAEAAQLRNTGWPIGLVLHREGLGPIPTMEGIEARVEHSGGRVWVDYWNLRKDGSYYVLRLLEEDSRPPSYLSSEGYPERPFWFDTRIWRITEVLLHSASLYRELGIAPTEGYLLAINHSGLEGRELSSSNMRREIHRGRICRVDRADWQREVTQDFVRANLNSLVFDIAKRLFVLFDFFEFTEEVVDQVIDEFLKSKV